MISPYKNPQINNKMEKTYAGHAVTLNNEGYLTDMNQWNHEVATEMAKEDGLNLGARHFEVLEYLRDQQKKDVALTIRGVGKSGVVDIKEFYELFPKGPLKISSRLAGIPKPKSCI
ncbi:sulfurtransferase TusE [Cloacibacterium rupense]|uniref:Sulfurtransferase TusE n=2 Tax=Cloacibacterium rupense TaxID=517423 RepID=A0ABQ2NLZ4_9FLAO|nr:sulfurtransferase TusE [Cloacibacterium rupense]